ncbi:hypothetical protein [Azospirillum picis]|uniref:Uncharacterized protein n=1 Tax=Azospirillum picis TaxID=488438 RepID=A0ABU0MUS4_9PROT|nr:hypothetical protein [Azospirillum picis]MBP2303065.1 hypothetical protein [Azospirillum picis]MDQ0536821.1 hypothetical protein [Azospirillum picis]
MVGDLLRLALGLEARLARGAAAASRLGADRDAALKSLDVLRDERDRLAAALEETVAGEAAGRWTARLDGLLESRSWSLSAPLRRRFGGADETRLAALPAARAVEAVLASAWWDMAAPVRLLARLLARRRR